jgi:hypothetical protein
MIWYFRSKLPGTKFVTMLRRIGQSASLIDGSPIYHYSVTDVYPDGTLHTETYLHHEPAPNLSDKEQITRLEYEQALTGSLWGPSEKAVPVDTAPTLF